MAILSQGKLIIPNQVFTRAFHAALGLGVSIKRGNNIKLAFFSDPVDNYYLGIIMRKLLAISQDQKLSISDLDIPISDDDWNNIVLPKNYISEFEKSLVSYLILSKRNTKILNFLIKNNAAISIETCESEKISNFIKLNVDFGNYRSSSIYINGGTLEMFDSDNYIAFYDIDDFMKYFGLYFLFLRAGKSSLPKPERKSFRETLTWMPVEKFWKKSYAERRL